MSIFTVTNNTAQLTATQDATDNFIGGIRFSANQSAVANGTYTVGTWANGIQLNPAGAVCVTNATLGIPAINSTSNSLIFDGNGSICASISSMVTYSNGLPMDANGALCVNLIP
jgi:hypothetical protein